MQSLSNDPAIPQPDFVYAREPVRAYSVSHAIDQEYTNARQRQKALPRHLSDQLRRDHRQRGKRRELPAGAVRGKDFQPFPAAVDVKAIRAKTGLSQAEFAKRYGFNVRTLQDWESSGTQPPSPVRAYLTLIDRFPDMVAKALKGAA